jgi:hypothetical protein
MLYWTYGVILNPGKLSAKYLAEQVYLSIQLCTGGNSILSSSLFKYTVVYWWQQHIII